MSRTAIKATYTVDVLIEWESDSLYVSSTAQDAAQEVGGDLAKIYGTAPNGVELLSTYTVGATDPVVARVMGVRTEEWVFVQTPYTALKEEGER